MKPLAHRTQNPFFCTDTSSSFEAPYKTLNMKLSFEAVQPLQAKSSTSWIRFFLLCSTLCLWRHVDGWSYHWSNHTMEWAEAREWCQERYTDMVAIQNQEEITHLNKSLPKRDNYYWIGIRKINDVWTWVGTNKALTPEATNWAKGEPNNGKDGSKKSQPEDCVEIYIKRTHQAGKWNDEKCSKQKAALCYSASCRNDSCYNGECIETINNHTCECHPGFYGTRCQHAVQCSKEKVIPPEHGRVDCSHKNGDFAYDSLCRHSCEEGYSLTSAGVQRCTSTGLWSEESPKCQLVQCRHLSRPEAGDIKCSHPLDRYSFQSSCSFTCQEGYEMKPSSPSTVHCEASGRWSDFEPSCVAVQCPALQDPKNGKVSCEDNPPYMFSFGGVCNFTCEPGFHPSGCSSVTCTSAGVWSDTIPQCVEMTCPVPEGGAQLITECSKPLTNLVPNSSCSFSCEPGYRLVGPGEVTCSLAGDWSDQVPQCVEITCPVPEGGAQLITECSKPLTNLVPNSSCSFSCESGYRLVGPGEVTCSSTGDWSHQIPQCVEITCPVPEGGAQLITECSKPLTNLRPNSSCSFSCEPGYRLVGPGEVTCSSTGDWSHQIPQCVEITCPVPEGGAQLITECSKPLTNLRPNSSCSFSCEPGYRLVGPGEVTCSSAGDWSHQIPQCVEITCPVLEGGAQLITECSKPLTNLVPNSSCSFSCEPGYRLVGPGEVTCSSAGDWSHQIPQCVEITCPVPEGGAQLITECSKPLTNLVPNSFCSFSCESGYRLVGPSEVTCSSAGDWSDQIPQCVEMTCPVPEGGAQLITECSKPLTNLRPNSSCSFSCEPGFELQGAAHRTCSQNGQWSGVPPSCKAVQCPPPEALENGYSNCTDSQPFFSSQCSFTCDEGFTLDGHELLTCGRHGNWTGKIPTCQAPSYQVSAITIGVTAGGAAAVSGLSLAMWILKRLKRKASKFELSSNSDIDEPPQVYKSSIDSLI